MLGEDDQFYAALDADSEGEEGKFYVWNEDELKQLIPASEFSLFKEYYNINSAGRWEHGNYILLRKMTDEAFAIRHNRPLKSIKTMVANWKAILLKEREKRTRPGLDNKGLCSWNALTVKAYVDASIAFNNPAYLERAVKTAAFIQQKLAKKDGSLWHTYSPGEAKINAFLDDYATVIDAWIQLFQATGNENWLNEAEQYAHYVIRHFDAGENALFYFAPVEANLLSRTIELSDNVIPATNSIMAQNLERLGIYFGKTNFRERAKKMAMQIKGNMYSYGEGFSNWGMLLLDWTFPNYEVAISGPDAEKVFEGFNDFYYPNLQYSWSTKKSTLPLQENRFNAKETLIYICQGNVCQLPTNNMEQAWTLLNK